MAGLGRLTDDDMAFIGIVLEGFCYGKIFCSVVIVISIINYSCSGLYSAVFVIYMQYPIYIKNSVSTRETSLSRCIHSNCTYDDFVVKTVGNLRVASNSGNQPPEPKDIEIA